MKKRIRIQGTLIFLAIITFILLYKFVFPCWKKEALDEFLDTVGIGLVLLGFLFRIAARGYKAESSPDARRLITDGPYKLMRHPMYFGTLLIGIGITVVLFEWWAFLLFFAIFLIIYIPQVRKEEKYLCKYFGEEYKNYRKVTPKYFPNLLALFTTNPRRYLFFRWRWIKNELVSLISVTTGIIVVEIWQDIRLFGHYELSKELWELALIISSFSIVILLLHEKKNIPAK